MEVVEWDSKPEPGSDAYLFGRVTGLELVYRTGITPGLHRPSIPNSIIISVLVENDHFATLAWLAKEDDSLLTADHLELKARDYDYLRGFYAKVQRRRDRTGERFLTRTKLFSTAYPALVELVGLSVLAQKHPEYNITISPEVKAQEPVLSS